jgi:hypothetical protein
MGFTTFVAHHDFYTIMDQIHLSSLVDQIQLALRHICNTSAVEHRFLIGPFGASIAGVFERRHRVATTLNRGSGEGNR